MPDAEILGNMYGDDYILDSDQLMKDRTLDKFGDVLDFVNVESPGTFIDYGCGDGRLLLRLRELGWNATGIDYNPDFASALFLHGIKVFSPDESSGY